MARRPSEQPTTMPNRNLSIDEMQRGIERLNQRIQELSDFDFGLIKTRANPPEIAALETAIERSLARIFGENTADYKRYLKASKLPAYFSVYYDGYPAHSDFVDQIKNNINHSKHLLQEAIRGLHEEISDTPESEVAVGKKNPTDVGHKIFVVHGQDDAAKQGLARFLEKLELEAIILHEQPSKGLTIIEKFEAYANQVAFAAVLMTPDDLGALASASAQDTRARQNVIFELGYFVGKLGRGKVCLLRKGHLEIPSDLQGVIYTEMDPSDGWKLSLIKELKAAGLEFDANKAWL